jgi:hypothetical protein
MNFSKKNHEIKKSNKNAVSKTLQLIITLLLISVFGNAQNGINYKALIKDDLGNVIVNTLVDIKFQILESDAQTNVYEETHSPTTDDNGIIIVNIGEGTIISGIFDDINWGNDNHFLNVKIDSGSGFINLGTIQFSTVPYALHAKKAANVKGLEPLDEGNGIGWRLVGRNSDNYGNIGLNAIDLSYSNLQSTTYGATGSNAIAMGVRTSANGYYSLALGSQSTASNDFTTAIGSGVTASGMSSTAIGVGSDATGDNSVVIGHNSEASGLHSTAMGNHTNAETAYSTAIGRYNIGGGTLNTWIDTDPLFEIGNGESDSDRNNALTILKNGAHTINSKARGLLVNAGSNPNDIGIYIDTPGGSGIRIDNPGHAGILINEPDYRGIQIINPSETGIYISFSENYGIFNRNSGIDGIRSIQANENGGYFSGGTTGVHAESTTINNPDIILGGRNLGGTTTDDDGIIASDPLYTSSDIYLRSNDAIVLELDNDNNESSDFIIRNSANSNVLTVNESGDTNINGSVTIGNELIEDGGNDVLAFSSSLVPNINGVDRLGGPNRRWLDVYTVNGVFQTSDRRSKTNIVSLNYGLAEILQIQPVSFNWKNKNNPETKLGLIAQDLQVIIPEVVQSHIWEKNKVSGALTKKELTRLGVYYSDLVPVLIKAIQEQQKIISREKSVNTKQNALLETLLSRVEQLETSISN